MRGETKTMRIKINNNRDDLYCLDSKEKIEIGEKYIEVIEDCLGDEIVKTYRFEHLETLSDEYAEIYNREPDILFGDE